uniref:U-box domain-containing protein n=1 Tax=Aplanochytrium stocchinoi TaxID=215587 RepID=A0A7S3LIM8_9STRA|mmetsp:Transcript_4675/g.5414  ORF Transcript_4675/g.5414 Transcript_4675/m.5414 type:complete len:591 (+) Transcript_4675:505-2277(+)
MEDELKNELIELETENWRCPILQTVFVDPVVASDGHTYERAAIQEWFKMSDETGNCLSPMTGFPLESKILLKNHALRNTIQDAIRKSPMLKEEQTRPEDVRSLTGSKFEDFNGPPKTGDLIDFGTGWDSLNQVEPETTVTEDSAKVSPSLDHIETDSKETTQVVLSQSQSTFLTISYSGIVKRWVPMPNAGSKKNSGNASWKCLDVKAYAYPGNKSLKGNAENIGFECTTCVTTTNDGFVVTGERDSSIRIWQWDTSGNLILVDTRDTLTGHVDGGICSIAAWPSPMGPILASGARDKTIRIWNASPEKKNLGANNNIIGEWEWRCKGKLVGHKDFVNCVDIELGSGSLLSASADWSVKLWDLLTMREVQTYDAHSYAVRCLSWASSGDSQLNIPMTGTFKESESNGSQSAATGSPSDVFCSGGDDEMVYVWDTRVKCGNKIARLSTGAMVLCCCWGPTNGTCGGVLPWLAAGGGTPSDSFNASSDNVCGWLRVYDPRMWKPLGDCTSRESNRERRSEGDSTKEREAHWCCVNSCSPVTLGDGSVGVFSSGRDSAVRIWQLPVGPGGLTSPRLVETLDCSKANQRLVLLK